MPRINNTSNKKLFHHFSTYTSVTIKAKISVVGSVLKPDNCFKNYARLTCLTRHFSKSDSFYLNYDS